MKIKIKTKGLYCSKCNYVSNNCELLECPKCNTSLKLINIDIDVDIINIISNKYLKWLKERKKAILELPDDNLQRILLDLHTEYVEEYIIKNDK